MTRKCFFSIGYGCRLLIFVTCIRLTTALKSTSDSYGRGVEVATNIIRNFGILDFRTGKFAVNARQITEQDSQTEKRSRNARSLLQSQDDGDASDQPTSFSTSTPTSSHRGRQNCLPIVQSQAPSVTLLRISPQFLLSSTSVAPITFSVDSTISKLSVEVNGTEPLGITIWDPTGATIDKRVKRQAIFARSDEQSTTSSSPSLHQLSLPSENNIVGVTRKHAIQLSKLLHRERRQTVQNEYIPHQRLHNYKYQLYNGLKGYAKMNRLGIQLQKGYHKFIYYNGQHRSRRSSSSAIENEDVSVWEMEQPKTGIWTITIGGPEPVQIAVTAQSSLDFRFEFLDIRTMTASTSQPVAYDTTLARLTLTSLGCVGNVTVFNLYNDAGETIAIVESDNVDVSLDQMTDDGKTAILVWFQMPDVPFYMSVTGNDIKGEQFQRLSSVRVVPRIFALSFVNFRTDALVPGSDYKFGVRLRNRGKTDTFKVVASWDNTDYITVKILPDCLKVDQDQISHVTVVIIIKPSISFVMKGELRINAIRTSDNVTDILRENVTAEPTSFLQDYEPPICTKISATGGCRPNMTCQSQRWGQAVAVTDSLTGVRSAVFMQPPPGAFNNIQFSYSMTNRTARADYRFTCCKMAVTLVAYDYANNPAYCKLVATILDLTTASSLHSEFSPGDGNIAVGTDSGLSLATVAAPSEVFRNDGTTSMSALTRRLFPLSPSLGRYTAAGGNVPGEPDVIESQNRSTAVVVSAPWRVITSMATPFLHTGESNSVTTINNSTFEKQQKWDPTKSSTLRLAAIICGSIAGVAGLTIAVICVLYRCVIKRRQRNFNRRRSNGSDVTMGSSSESRSEGSSANSSLRMSKLESRMGKLSNGYNTYQMSELDGRLDDISKNIQMTAEKQKSRESVDQYVRGGHRNTGKEHRPVTEIGNGQVASPRGKEVEDVTFRCVVVKSLDQGNKKEGMTDGAGEEVKKVSYSPMLRSGGKTYINMLQVQKQMDEMDKQRLRLSYAASESDAAERPELNKIHKSNNKPENIRNEGATVDRRIIALKNEGSYYDATPGSPQLSQKFQNSSLAKEEICEHAAALAEDAVPIRCQTDSSSLISSTNKLTKQHVVRANSAKTIPGSYGDKKVSKDQAELVASQQSTRAGVVTHRTLKDWKNNNFNDADSTDNFLNIRQNQSISSGQNLGSTHEFSTTGTATMSPQANVFPKSSDTSSKLVTDSDDYSQESPQIHQSQEGSLELTASSERRANTAHRKRTKLYQQARQMHAHRRFAEGSGQEVRTHVLEHHIEEDYQQTSSKSGQQKSLPSIQSSASNICRKQGVAAANYINIIVDTSIDEIQNGEMGSHKTQSQKPKSPYLHPRPKSPDPRLGHQTDEPGIITDASQMALRYDLEHIRQKLLKFQRRIDQEIDVDVRRSREHSPCSSSLHSNNDND